MFSSSRYDIIEKFLTDLTRVFAELARYDTTEALEEIQTYYQGWLGLDRQLIIDHSSESLLEFLLKKREFSNDHLDLLARLLAKEGEILVAEQQFSLAKDQFQKALVIFGYVEQHSQLFSQQRRNTIEFTKTQLANISNQPDI